MQRHSYLCNFIQSHPEDWETILSGHPYFLRIRHEENLAIFNYDLTIHSSEYDPKTSQYIRHTCDFTLPEVQEARGIIIDLDTLDVVCWPFRKFGNYGEYYADEIDWPSASVLEKIDGSLVKLWFYKGEWRISSNKSILAEGPLPSGRNIREVFLEAAGKQYLDWNLLCTDYTYMFELTGPENHVVLNYPEPYIYHIGTRDNTTGRELVRDIGIAKPKAYPLCTLYDCIEAAKHLNDGCKESDLAHEGFVVDDRHWNRIKIKSPEYIMAHGMLNNGVLGTKKILHLILSGDDEEYLSYCPEREPEFTACREKLSQIQAEMSDAIRKYRELWDACNGDRKQFAEEIRGEKWNSLGFCVADGRTDEEIFGGIKEQTYLHETDGRTKTTGKEGGNNENCD